MGSIIGGLFGVGSGANQASQQASNAASEQAQNASKISNYLMSIIGGNQGAYDSEIAPAMSSLFQALQSGISNPTSLTGLSDIAPGLESFFSGKMNTNAPVQGLDKGFVQNQYSQVNQSATQGLNDILSRTGPGGNPSAAIRDNQNSLLGNTTNLAGTLAGENQQFEQQQTELQDQQQFQGAQGLLTTGQGLDTETMNTQNLRQQLMQLVQQFVNTGVGQQESGMGALGGLGSQAQQGSQFDYGLSQQDASIANQQQNDFFNSLISLGTSFLPGGQFASLFSGGGTPSWGPNSPFGEVGQLFNLGG